MTTVIRGFLAAWLLFVAALDDARADDGPALTLHLIRPDEQGERVIGLFRGARVPHPAAALAAWKHATHGQGSLGKSIEAVISMGNPGMVREFRGLDGTSVRFWLSPNADRPLWQVAIPHDDGSFAAFATAIALTDGACEPPIGDSPVLRVGPPGAPVSAVRDGRLTLATNRDGLRAALDRIEPSHNPSELPTGISASLDPSALRASTTVNVRRLSALLDAIGCASADAQLALLDETLTLQTTARLDRRHANAPALEPAWLDVVPSSHVVGAAALALDTRPPALEATFASFDRVEKADPARAEVAPLRTRLNLLAAAARVRPEVDLWPALKGVTVALLVDDAHEPAGALAALHARDATSASKIARDVLPRLTASFLKTKKTDAPADGVEVLLGRIQGRPLSVTTRGSTVLVGWGDGALAAALDALADPVRSAGAALRADWGSTPPQRIGFLWPGRLRRSQFPTPRSPSRSRQRLPSVGSAATMPILPATS